MSPHSRTWKNKKKEIKVRQVWLKKFLREFVKENPTVQKKLVCSIYRIPRSTLYYKPKKIITDTLLKTKIQVTHIFSPYYGYRRCSYELEMNQKKVLRIVQIYFLYGRTRKRKFCKPWDRNIPNMWVQNEKKTLEIQKIHQVWNSDFTHIYYKNTELFLATVLDEYSKQIVWYKIWFHHSKELIIEAVSHAVQKSKTTPLILHSDQWSEYRSYEYFETLKRYNIWVSMSRKSSPWENGAQESFYWKLKFEIWNLNRFEKVEQVIEAIHLWIYYYNNHRIHTSLKMSPKQFELLHSNMSKN
jgi:transposase InsO family protein